MEPLPLDIPCKSTLSAGVVNSSVRAPKEGEAWKAYRETCVNCKMKVSVKALFCGHCGQVQIKNDLIHGSSTSIYDPGDRTVRPWREPSIVAKNSWKKRNKNVQMRKREPWCPSMSNSRVNKKVVFGVPSVIESSITDTKKTKLTAPERRKQYDQLRKCEVLYRGRIWRRAGEKHKRKHALQSQPSMFSMLTNAPVDEGYKKERPIEEVFPLAVFDVDWMKVSDEDNAIDKSDMSIHISLYQHLIDSDGLETTTTKVQRWLRVGYLLESKPSQATQASSTLKILEFLPNAVAKCMGVRESDWVDLDYIDSDNSYMIDHLEKSLVRIARRVVSRSADSAVTYDQMSTILFVDSEDNEAYCHGDEGDTEGEERVALGGSYSRVARCIRKLISKESFYSLKPHDESSVDYIRRHLEAAENEDAWASNLFQEYQERCKAEKGLGNEVDLGNISLDTTVAQITYGIPLSAFYLNKRIMTKVWMTVDCNKEEGDSSPDKPTVPPDSQRDNFCVSPLGFEDSQLSPVVTSKNPKDSYADDSDIFLARKPVVESVTLRLYPMYYDEADVMPKIIRFTAWSLVKLLDFIDVRHQLTSSDECHEFKSNERLDSRDVSAYVFSCLSSGGIGAKKLCMVLTKLLRYEHTSEGVRVCVDGVENNFFISKSPEEARMQYLENEHACVIIQCLMRQAIARRKMRRLWKIEKIRRDAERSLAAVQIQRVCRGFLDRILVQALLKQKAENEENARLLAEEEAREKILFCDMNGTSVEVVADGGESTVDSSSSEVIDLTELNVHVTDQTTRMCTTLSLNRADICSIWALYVSKFRKMSFDRVEDVFNNIKARKKLLLFMVNKCLELFLSRQNNFIKLSLLNLFIYVYEIIVKVVSAKNLVNADSMLGGVSDPYIKLGLGDEKFKTTTKKNNLNPEFNEETSFKWNHQDLLHIEVMDKDLILKDDSLGKCSVDITTIGVPSINPIFLDLELTGCDHGSVQIEVISKYDLEHS